jgi:hypothetical protein
MSIYAASVTSAGTAVPANSVPATPQDHKESVAPTKPSQASVAAPAQPEELSGIKMMEMQLQVMQLQLKLAEAEKVKIASQIEAEKTKPLPKEKEAAVSMSFNVTQSNIGSGKQFNQVGTNSGTFN